jgi:hypothetical protein
MQTDIEDPTIECRVISQFPSKSITPQLTIQFKISRLELDTSNV